ncbi:hypothetical protein MXB_2815 [Myxobolus squamalis]|nr:hypothetical protein MXB_2815 [Myxobolus squamalis]
MLILLMGNHKNHQERRNNHVALQNEIRDAKVAQDDLDRKRKLFEELEVLETSYKSYVDCVRQNTKIQDDMLDKLCEMNEKIVKNVACQIAEVNLLAKKEPQVCIMKNTAIIRNRQREIAISKEAHANGGLMTGFADAHEKNMCEFRSRSERDLQEAPMKVDMPPKINEYEDIRRIGDQEISMDIKNISMKFEAADKLKNDKSLPPTSMKSRDMSKFETLRLVTKNNVQTRVDKFESL